jgi:uncharacterized Zn finger protein
MDCNCPDHAVPCKHLAAVFYVLAERFDTDPFQILALRGRDRAALLEDLRARRAELAERAGGPQTTPDGPAPLDRMLDTFFLAGPDRGAWPTGPRTAPDALLDQIPEFTIAVRGERVNDLLRSAYLALDGRD